MKIEDQIKQFVLKNLYFAEDNALDNDASFLDTGVVDSTGVMELVAFVESEFGVKVEPQEIVVENFDSISKVARFISRKKRPIQEPQEAPEVTPLAVRPSTVVEN
jgi:acyl carrier protein